MNITKKTRVAFVKHMISTNDKWMFRSIEVIFQNQTADEQATESTRHNNGIGFCGWDAPILSSFARQIELWNMQRRAGATKYKSPLSPKQTMMARRKMPKYAKQIVDVSNIEQLDRIISNRS